MSEDVEQLAANEKSSTATSVNMARDPKLFALFASAQSLPGVGPNLTASLRRVLQREEPRVLDILLQPPLTERNLEALEDVSLWADGAKVTLAVQIGEHSPPPRGSKAPYKVRAFAEDQPLDLVFFHAKGRFVADRFPPDSQKLIYGRLGNYRDRWQMAHPEILPDDESEKRRTSLVYAMSEGLTQFKMKKLVEEAVKLLPELDEWQTQVDIAFGTALKALHGLSQPFDVLPQRARQRLALDELLATQLALQLARRMTGQIDGRSLRANGELRFKLLAALPFSPTGAQERSMAAIRADMALSKPMLRLLMGDVGSGKTLVAFAAMLDAIEAGGQAILMAPTEILARQHAKGLQAMAEALGIEIGVLIGSDRESVKRITKSRLAEGSLKMAVGTHALFQQDVVFDDLALAVIDEQHRFGVQQRMELIRKGVAVDVLLMTATPIPRSLVLARYGDIDVSKLDEKPPGRQPIRTVVISAERLDEVVRAVGRAIEAGDRVYWVCPVIDQALEEETPTAEDRFQMLQRPFGTAAALVHGRMATAEKTQAMQRFAEGDATILVATTVIEVGVDVPEATVIVIDGAEHFGLAQLHQLRGRVGRGDRASSAILLYNPPISKSARQRLAIMRESDDGFRIAEEDLKLRGPGDLLGSRQSGFAALKFADLSSDMPLIDAAKAEARELLAVDPRLESARGRAARNLLQIFDHQVQHSWLEAG